MSNKPQTKSFSLFTAGVITTISITLVLFLLGLTMWIGFAAKGMTAYVKENLGMSSIELSEDINEAQVKQLQRELDANPYIKKAMYVTKAEVKKQIIEDLGRDPEEVLGYDPSRSYFDIAIKADYVDADSMKLVEQSLQGKRFIKGLIYDKNDINYANANLSTIGSVLFILAIILIFISFTLIRSIIQLNIYSKRFLINTMQLVGATNGFIRRPFILSMVGCGIIAAILASIAITGVVYYIATAFPLSITMVGMNELLIVFASILVFGMLIAALATASAVNRYLKMTTNKLYRA